MRFEFDFPEHAGLQIFYGVLRRICSKMPTDIITDFHDAAVVPRKKSNRILPFFSGFKVKFIFQSMQIGVPIHQSQGLREFNPSTNGTTDKIVPPILYPDAVDPAQIPLKDAAKFQPKILMKDEKLRRERMKHRWRIGRKNRA